MQVKSGFETQNSDTIHYISTLLAFLLKMFQFEH